MIVRALGLGDLITVLIVIFAQSLPHKAIIYGAFFLLLKGGLFFMMTRDIASIIDFTVGIYMVFLAFGAYSQFFHFLSIIFLGQKGLFSLLKV